MNPLRPVDPIQAGEYSKQIAMLAMTTLTLGIGFGLFSLTPIVWPFMGLVIMILYPGFVFMQARLYNWMTCCPMEDGKEYCVITGRVVR